jgi:hypothetical protein
LEVLACWLEHQPLPPSELSDDRSPRLGVPQDDDAVHFRLYLSLVRMVVDQFGASSGQVVLQRRHNAATVELSRTLTAQSYTVVLNRVMP